MAGSFVWLTNMPLPAHEVAVNALLGSSTSLSLPDSLCKINNGFIAFRSSVKFANPTDTTLS